MLHCDYRLEHKTEALFHYTDKGTPPVIDIKIPFNGRYAIFAGMLYDGTAISNNFAGTLYFRDCGHSDAVAKHAEDYTVFGQSAG